MLLYYLILVILILCTLELPFKVKLPIVFSYHLEDLGIDGRIILERILGK